MATLTSRDLAQSTAITPTTLVHIVTTADTSQSINGSSYKAELQQLSSIFSGESITFSGGTVTGLTSTGLISTDTLSATTYENLPVSGLTEGTNINLTNNSGNVTISVTGITGGYQYYSAITVTSAQTLSLNTLPVTLLPAPGVNKYYDFKVLFEYNFNTTQYTSNPVVVVDNTSNPISNEFDIQSSNNVVLVSDMNSQSNLTNVNSELKLFAKLADPTGGDGSLKIKIYYNIINFG